MPNFLTTMMHLAAQVPDAMRAPVIAEAKAMLVSHYSSYDRIR